ncbi:MAG: class I SAM-dependent RNA methyltransferase [Bdellovibrionales bacterium]|nr:class I SAM-dependent RNA methyltransferase [Bdellovibrionales bacterium]
MHQITVKITDLSRGGSGVARLESGEVVFIPFTSPGDEVLIEIVEIKKNYLHGKLLEVVRPSPNRIKPECHVFGKCGGCEWQHLPYTLQFETKKRGVLHALARAGVPFDGISIDDLPAANPYSYRNRIQMNGDVAAKTFGFYSRGSKVIVDTDSCSVASDAINSAIPRIREEGFKTHRENFKAEITVDAEDPEQLDVTWNMPNAANGFRQINDEQNAVLQGWIAKHTADAETLLDLFGGAGNLSLGIAKKFKEVHCVDIRVPKDSSFPHFHFHKGTVSSWLPTFKKPGSSVSLILDPPREGLSQEFERITKSVEKYPVQTMILVGCDVDAFVRDTHRFIKHGFKLKRLGILDLFPQTTHVESLALFTR